MTCLRQINIQPWPQGSPEQQGLSSEALKIASERVRRIRYRQCFLVIKGGHLVYERYYYGQPNSPVYAFSLTKSFVSALIGVAVTQGILGLDERLIDLGVPLSASMHSQSRVQHVLSQVSQGPEPGLLFRYNSGEVINTLSLALTAALRRQQSGLSVIDYAQRYFLDPMGMQDTHWSVLPQQQLRVGYGIRTSGRDSARLGQLFLNQGRWQGQTLISPEYIAAALRPQYPAANGAHGYLWWLNQSTERWIRPVMRGTGKLIAGAPEDLFMATGMSGNFIYVFPGQDMIVVSLGHSLSWRIESLVTARDIFHAFQEIL